ncbi:hypothetical protein ACLK17_00340 [Escherichia coli]
MLAPKQRERQRIVIEAMAKKILPHLLKIFAKSFNYRGCYEHVFSSLGIQRYPSRLPELMNGARLQPIKSMPLSSMMPMAHRQSSSALIMSGN